MLTQHRLQQPALGSVPTLAQQLGLRASVAGRRPLRAARNTPGAPLGLEPRTARARAGAAAAAAPAHARRVMASAHSPPLRRLFTTSSQPASQGPPHRQLDAFFADHPEATSDWMHGTHPPAPPPHTHLPSYHITSDQAINPPINYSSSSSPCASPSRGGQGGKSRRE
eukprot:scaffold412_cov388-Prasinococcus_capsulatus_cf.AAC.53